MSESEGHKGLIGGDLELRARLSRVPPIVHPLVLAPFRTDGDDAALRAFATEPLPGQTPASQLHIEIGFGRPYYLLALAAQNPNDRILGFEIKRDWVRVASDRATRQGITNIRVVEGDARGHIERLIADDSVDAYHVLFPDPWWKKRHHKRRVFNAEFVALLVRTLKPGGMLVLKTDVEAYADQVREDLAEHAALVLAGTGTADPILAALPASHREGKCIELGVPVFRLRFTKVAP